MSKIADNQSLKNLVEASQGLALLDEYLSIVGLGKESSGAVLKQVKDQITLPDRFNESFKESGWIATEDMSVSMMEKALEICGKEGIDNAEKYLCSQFDDDYFQRHSHRMKAIWVWRNSSRERLLTLAYEDHKHGRYHASIPVVLAQIDGLSIDINRELFFGNKSDLVINDSVAAHETGLRVLSKKAGKPRNKTSDNPIYFPYRHGILHGRELAYDNPLVSTKCFFLLFALRPWALKYQQDALSREIGDEVTDSAPS